MMFSLPAVTLESLDGGEAGAPVPADVGVTGTDVRTHVRRDVWW